MSKETFLQDFHGKSWKYFPGVDQRFKKLADWDVINYILATQRFDTPRFRVAQKGRLISAEQYTYEIDVRTAKPYRNLNIGKFLEEIRDGGTLAIDHIDEAHLPLRDLALQLESELRAYVSIDAFASWAAVPAFGTHWDDRDVLVLQLAGSKHWRIWGPTREWPLYRDVVETPRPADDVEPLAELDISSGDVLYVPHGWWHSVNATKEPSLHLTIGISQDCGLDLLMWLVRRAHADELFRRRLPRFESSEDRNNYVDSFREHWNELMNMDGLLERFLADSDGTGFSRSSFTLPDILSESSALKRRDAVITLLTGRTAISMQDEGYVLSALGRRWVFPANFRSLLDLIITNKSPLTVGTVLDKNRDLGESQVASVIFQLQRAGVIALIEEN